MADPATSVAVRALYRCGCCRRPIGVCPWDNVTDCWINSAFRGSLISAWALEDSQRAPTPEDRNGEE